MNSVFVIGNGFDLDLGFNTRYIDFWTSDEFSEHRNQYYGLISYLNEKATNYSTWFDIEKLIREYVRNDMDLERRIGYGLRVVERDKAQFEQIRSSLASYLEHEMSVKNINSQSCAARVLKKVVDASFTSIYSFNYTNLNEIARKLSIKKPFDYKSVHGLSSDSTLILGINDGADTKPQYEFTYKTFSPYYKSIPLKFDLETAKEVVIFGLSMGDIDYPYFQDFFREICNPVNGNKDRKQITILTFDESSRIDILRQLRTMNEKRVSYMFGQNDLTFIRTSVPEDEPKLMQFLEHLDKVKINNRNKITTLL